MLVTFKGLGNETLVLCIEGRLGNQMFQYSFIRGVVC